MEVSILHSPKCQPLTSVAFQSYIRPNSTVIPTSLYIQQLKERLAQNSSDPCATLEQLFYPSQLDGTYQHPTALSPSEWILSNLNTFETNRTNWNTTFAGYYYHSDPTQGSSWCGSSTSSEATRQGGVLAFTLLVLVCAIFVLHFER